MPKQKLALEEGGPKRLEVEWTLFFRSAHVKLDGTVLGSFASTDELSAGRTFPLPDGRMLGVKLVKNAQLEVTRDGRPLPGSSTHPATHIRSAVMVLYMIGLITLGMATTRPAVLGFGSDTAVAVGAAVEGVLFLVLGALTHRRMRWALLVATVLYAIDAVSMMIAFPSAANVVFRLVLLFMLVQGIRAFRDLERLDATSAAATFQ